MKYTLRLNTYEFSGDHVAKTDANIITVYNMQIFSALNDLQFVLFFILTEFFTFSSQYFTLIRLDGNDIKKHHKQRELLF